MATETLKTIASRRSVRIFDGRDVPNEIIEQILNAANQAPSAHNKQSWRFVVARGGKKDELAQLASSMSGRFSRSSAALLRMAARSINSSPAVIAVINTGELVHHGGDLFGGDLQGGADFLRTMEIQSSAAAVENLLLAATALGVASVWLGILYLIKDEALSLLEEPAGEFMAVVPLGYSDREMAIPPKKALSATVKYLCD